MKLDIIELVNNNLNMEVWKEIWVIDNIDFQWLYQISSIGRVKSMDKMVRTKWWVLQLRKERILKWCYDKDGYIFFSLSNNYKIKSLRSHRLVWMYFITNLDNKSQINHINWIKDDNRVENLEWCTASENELHKHRVLGYKNNFQTNHPHKWIKGEKHFMSKRINQFAIDWEFIKTWWSMSDVTRELWIATSNITKCCQWWYKTCWGFVWKYLELK